MIELEYVTSKKITGSTTPHSVDTFNIHGRPVGVVLKLRYRNVQDGCCRIYYRMKGKGEMPLDKDHYSIDFKRGRITLNWNFELDCTFVVEYQYDPGT